MLFYTEFLSNSERRVFTYSTALQLLYLVCSVCSLIYCTLFKTVLEGRTIFSMNISTALITLVSEVI